jgi:hypothetical protein
MRVQQHFEVVIKKKFAEDLITEILITNSPGDAYDMMKEKHGKNITCEAVEGVRLVELPVQIKDEDDLKIYLSGLIAGFMDNIMAKDWKKSIPEILFNPTDAIIDYVIFRHNENETFRIHFSELKRIMNNLQKGVVTKKIATDAYFEGYTVAESYDIIKQISRERFGNDNFLK